MSSDRPGHLGFFRVSSSIGSQREQDAMLDLTANLLCHASVESVDMLRLYAASDGQRRFIAGEPTRQPASGHSLSCGHSLANAHGGFCKWQHRC